MSISFLFPIIKSDFSFSKLQISKGIFLIDISNKKNWSSEGLKEANNVGVLLTPGIKNSRIGGASDAETTMDILLIYCFLKTKRTYDINRCYEVELDKNGKLELTSKKPMNLFKKYGWVLIPYYNFVFGKDRRNLLTKDLFKKVKEGKRYFSNYSFLITAQLGAKIKSPLGVAINTFVAAFANQGQDDPKYILVVAALESLFSISSSEVAFRLSSNIAWFLYPEPSDHKKRKEKFKEVKKLYNFRSRVVHGEYQEIPIEAYDAILDLFSTIIQKILEKYKLPEVFLDEKKHKEFIRDLEVGHLNY